MSWGRSTSSRHVDTHALLIEGSSSDGSGTVVGRSGGSHLVLAAGTYTIEATTRYSGAVGTYSVWASWAPAYEPLAVVLAGSASVELVYDVVLDSGSVPSVGASGYELRWRRVGEREWSSADAGAGLSFAVRSLVRGALYEVQARAVWTGGETAVVLYVTGWSAPGSGIAGAWTPANVRVASGDRTLVVSWDDVPVASRYVVEYWPEDEPSVRAVVVAVRDGDRWRADITGLAESTAYGVAVRSVRTAGGQQAMSDPVTSFAVPGTYVGASMRTSSYLGVFFRRHRVIRYSVWWQGDCDGDFVLWDRYSGGGEWRRLSGLAYTSSGDGGHTLTAPELGIDTTSLGSYRAALSSSEGRRLQLRCSPQGAALPSAAQDPPGRLVGEVAFRRSGGSSPPAPAGVSATVDGTRRQRLVSWQPFTAEQLARVGSSIVGYDGSGAGSRAASSGPRRRLLAAIPSKGSRRAARMRCGCAPAVPPMTVCGRRGRTGPQWPPPTDCSSAA